VQSRLAFLHAGGRDLAFDWSAEHIDGDIPFAVLDFSDGVEAARAAGVRRLVRPAVTTTAVGAASSRVRMSACVLISWAVEATANSASDKSLESRSRNIWCFGLVPRHLGYPEVFANSRESTYPRPVNIFLGQTLGLRRLPHNNAYGAARATESKYCPYALLPRFFPNSSSCALDIQPTPWATSSGEAI
jgi:hypothetical protein